MKLSPKSVPNKDQSPPQIHDATVKGNDMVAVDFSAITVFCNGKKQS